MLIIGRWHSRPARAGRAWVLPDGCRDLILRRRPDNRGHWAISPLFDRATRVPLAGGQTQWGFRLAPGAVFDAAQLLRALAGLDPEPALIEAALAAHGHTPALVEDALHELARPDATVAAAARRLRIGERRLQRQLLALTGRPPSYWRRLARVRAAGRALLAGQAPVDAALAAGYADQSHLGRDCRHWLGCTPAQLRERPPDWATLWDSGYDAAPATAVHSSTKKPDGSRT